MIPPGALVALVVIGAGLGLATRRALPRVRSTAALSAVVVYVAAMFGLSHMARGVSLASLRAVQRAEESGDIVDIVLNPNPAVPVCWTALAIEKRESRDEYILRRGNLSLFDGWLPDRLCRSSSGTVAGSGKSRAEWSTSSRQSLSRLRTRSRDDCWVRGWLQFGRAPAMTNDHIGDYRFGGEEGGNFTSMRLLDSTLAKVCPPHLTNWGMPRADLLSGALEN
jgi:inner membrane protein